VDFATIKANVRIVDVLARRGISLRYNGEWGSAVCPLPTHKPGDRDKTFQVNVKQNYFKCWSASCNEKAGKKGGDVINLVALLENCSEYEAAKKLSEMFHIENEKAALRIVERPASLREKPVKDSQKHSTSSDSVQPEMKYMASIDQWFDELIKPRGEESEEAYWLRLRKSVKQKLVESFRAGKAQR
jgi:DNA primase